MAASKARTTRNPSQPVTALLEKQLAEGRRILAVEEKRKCSTAEALKHLKWSGDKSLAYKARKFANGSLLKELLDIKGNLHEIGISWEHVVVLQTIKLEDKRKELTSNTIEKSWSAKRLRAEAGIIQPKRRNSGRRFEPMETRVDVWRCLATHLDRPIRFLEKVLDPLKPAENGLTKKDREVLAVLLTALQAGLAASRKVRKK